MLAIIPARGGSKGLPGKNVKKLNGKPLIAYSIEAALESNAIDRVIVSTDSAEIAEIALKYGAGIPFMRPGYLAEDSSLAVDNYIYTIDRYEKECGVKVDAFCVLQPTSPLRISNDIDDAVNIFNDKKADSVISYCEEHHPVSWHKYLEDDGRLSDVFSGQKLKNRQDIKPTYYPNGAIYVFKSSIIKLGQYYSDKTFAYVMPRERSVDIDVLDDFKLAEFLMDSK
jgi:CMP-N,N'-diacetyllegionaminic acid synthase